MKLELPDDAVVCVIDALRYVAHMEAGQTQAPMLCKPEDYEEWDLANRIEKSLIRSRIARRVHEEDEA